MSEVIALPVSLTDEQRQAVFSDDSSFCVIAAAGSGKTRVLTERYVRLVTEKGMSPSEILTVTFTRKAAEEMRSRIVGRLLNLGLVAQAQDAETGPIQTLHSFCERVLREQAFLAGLDPFFEIVMEPELGMRKEIALREILEREIHDHPDWVPYLRRRSGTSSYRGSRAIDSFVRNEVYQILDKVRSSAWTLAEFRHAFRSPEQVLASWKRRAIIDSGYAISEDLPFEDILSEIKSAAKRTGRKAPVWVNQIVKEEEELKAAAMTCAACQIAAATWQEYESRLVNDQKLDQSMLESRCVALVGEHPSSGAQLRREIRAVLVDEAQDLNPVQFKLLEALAFEQTMMVGDPQQAVYSFRGSDRELFLQRTSQTKLFRLTQNKRSAPGILTFVDRVFGSWWGEEYLPMTPPSLSLEDDVLIPPFGVELWPCEVQRVEKGPAEIAGYIHRLLESGETPGNVAVLVRTKDSGRAIATQLQRLGVPYQLVLGGEKFYARMEVHDLASALEALVDPTDELALLSFLRGPFVGLSMDSVVLFAASGGDFASLAGFQTPVAEDQAALESLMDWAPHLMSYADRMPAWELLSVLLSRTMFFARLATWPQGEQALANVRKLLQYATSLPDTRAREFAHHIRKIQRLNHEESDADLTDLDDDVIKILTVHRAKGLEFKTVVMPDFMTESRKMSQLAIDPNTHQVALVASRTYKPAIHRMVKERHESAQARELERLFYVAMTRAEVRLCLSVPVGGNKAPAGRVAHLVGFDGVNAPGTTVRRPPGSRP